jgi:hypothetical protein
MYIFWEPKVIAIRDISTNIYVYKKLKIKLNTIHTDKKESLYLNNSSFGFVIFQSIYTNKIALANVRIYTYILMRKSRPDSYS